MSRKRRDAGDKTRIQIVCSRQQRMLLMEASKVASTDLSTFILAHSLRHSGHGGSVGSPMILSGPVADRLRRVADDQGIPADRALDQLLVAGAS